MASTGGIWTSCSYTMNEGNQGGKGRIRHHKAQCGGLLFRGQGGLTRGQSECHRETNKSVATTSGRLCLLRLEHVEAMEGFM